MSTRYVEGYHPLLGEITVECEIESWGYASNGWDDPGAGIEWYVDRVMSPDEVIIWYMPNNDYDSVYMAIDDKVQKLQPDDDYGWIE